jgi:hypothetical protein
MYVDTGVNQTIKEDLVFIIWIIDKNLRFHFLFVMLHIYYFILAALVMFLVSQNIFADHIRPIMIHGSIFRSEDSKSEFLH